eukprot:11735148-Karenia_brevis.AAC.1
MPFVVEHKKSSRSSVSSKEEWKQRGWVYFSESTTVGSSRVSAALKTEKEEIVKSEDAMQDAASNLTEEVGGVEDMTLDQLKAELTSLNKQAVAVKDLTDPRSMRLKSYLQKEI